MQTPSIEEYGKTADCPLAALMRMSKSNQMLYAPDRVQLNLIELVEQRIVRL